MKTFGKSLIVMACVIVAAGCATVRKAAVLGLDGAKMAKPEYAGVIEQIKNVVAQEPVNPVEGFAYSVIYRVDGVVVDKAQITREEIFKRVQGVEGAVFSEGEKPIADTNAELRSQIEAILTAAGVE